MVSGVFVLKRRSGAAHPKTAPACVRQPSSPSFALAELVELVEPRRIRIGLRIAVARLRSDSRSGVKPSVFVSDYGCSAASRLMGCGFA
jgi:hypothetical protein